MQDRKFSFFNFMGEGGDIRGKEGNPDRQESHVSLDLSLSLGSTSSSTPTDKHKEAKKSICMEKCSGAFPSESKNTGTDAGISLELSLSCGSISTKTAKTNEKKQLITRALDVCDMKCMEKSSGAFSSESSGISLELCLSMDKSSGIKAGESSNQHSRGNNVDLNKDFYGGFTLSLNAGFTSNKKRKRMESPNPSNHRNKRRRLNEPDAEVRVVQDHDPWCIKKKLKKSDLDDLSRLLLPKSLVESHILLHWDTDRLSQIPTEKGLDVSVFDLDTNTDYPLVFKRWKNGCYVFIQNWILNFVMRRNLELNDEIGLYWDVPNSRFNFSVLHRAPRE